MAARQIIIADDLTGANDTAIQFVKQGMPAIVVRDDSILQPDILHAYNVISINTNTRDMETEDAVLAVKRLMGKLKDDFSRYSFYKKIDSVLRGHPAEELSAMMTALDIPLAIAAPSFPANLSTVRKGILQYGNRSLDAVKLFSSGSGKKAANIPLEILRQGIPEVVRCVCSGRESGASIFVADAVSEQDLEVIYKSAENLGEPFILAGAAGLANHLALCMREEQDSSPEQAFSLYRRTAPVLMLAGTRQRETALQIKALAQAAQAPVISFPVSLAARGKTLEAVEAAEKEAAQWLAGNPDVCIIAADSMFPPKAFPETRDGIDGSAISAAFGVLAEKLVEQFRFPAIFITGGDTALSVCRSLSVLGIEPRAEICPGVPIGKIVGGKADAQFIITKSGRFGGENTLVEIMRYLKIPVPKESLAQSDSCQLRSIG